MRRTPPPREPGFQLRVSVPLGEYGPAQPMAFAHFLEQHLDLAYAFCHTAHNQTPPQMHIGWRTSSPVVAARCWQQLPRLLRAAGYGYGERVSERLVGLSLHDASGQRWRPPRSALPAGPLREQLYPRTS